MSTKAFLGIGSIVVILLAVFGAMAVAQDMSKDPLSAEVEAGNLPPLAERLPNNPLVSRPRLIDAGSGATGLGTGPAWRMTLRTAFTSAFGLSGELFVMNVEQFHR